MLKGLLQHVAKTSVSLLVGTTLLICGRGIVCLPLFGANVAGLSPASKKTIETFLRYQRSDGLVPCLVRRSKLTISKYFGKHHYYETPKPQFRSSQSGGLVPDGGLMVVIASHNYVETTRDISFLRRNFRALQELMEWYYKKFDGGLIREWFLCEWADSVMKIGTTLYTNIVYWKALGDMSRIASRLNKSKKAAWWHKLQDNVRGQLNERLWNSGYFADWKNVWRHDYFSSLGNMLAVVWGLADKEQTRSILAYAKDYCWNGWTLEENYPRYPWWRISLVNHLAGIPDYHNRGCLWLQPRILYALALGKTGYKKEAYRVLTKIAEKIVEHQGVFEVYEKSGKPVKRLFYQSEQPFAWSAGLFLWAYSILRRP